MIAALYVLPRGCYFGLSDVDPWDEGRDARRYDGPWSVVAHPPCERWGRYAAGGPASSVEKVLGDDGGCFASALESVRQFGGVLEHPEGSQAWKSYGLTPPPRPGGWVPADGQGGWTCCVEQGHYGHRARKATWLYACGTSLPVLRWGPSPPAFRDLSHLEPEAKKRAIKTGICQRLSSRQRKATPPEFRDILLSIARSCYDQ